MNLFATIIKHKKGRIEEKKCKSAIHRVNILLYLPVLIVKYTSYSAVTKRSEKEITNVCAILLLHSVTQVS